jgi:hypothetical protein
MQHSPSDDDRSYFDLYATATLKEAVKEFIWNPTNAQGWAKNGSAQDVEFTNGKALTRTMEMQSGTQYYLLAVARRADAVTSEVDGDSYGFRALPVNNKTIDPPAYIYTNPQANGSDWVNASITNTTGSDTTGLTNKYTGSVTISFDQPLYWMEGTSGDSTPIPIVTDPDADGETAIFIGNLASNVNNNYVSDCQFTVSNTTSSRPTNSFRFTYTDLMNNATLQFPTTGYLCNEDGDSAVASDGSTAAHLILTFKVTNSTANTSETTYVTVIDTHFEATFK